jgi:universal stress protein A
MKIKPAPKKGEAIITLQKKDEKILSKLAPQKGFQLKKILVPLDFSDRSRKALQYAIAFARQFDSTLILMHVVQINYVGGEFGAVEYPLPADELVDGSQKRMAELVAANVPKETPYQVIVKTGHVMGEIVNAAKDLDVDLIVISTHGFTGFKHVLLGSNAESVIRHAPCPVLTVREREHDFVTDTR